MGSRHRLGVFEWFRKKKEGEPRRATLRPEFDIRVNYYDVLRVPESSTPQELRRNFMDLAKLFHPDRNPGDARAKQKYIEISKAYDILSNPEKRLAYDRARAAAGRAPSGAPPVQGGYPSVPPPAEEAPRSEARPEAPSEVPSFVKTPGRRAAAPPSSGPLSQWEIMFGRQSERPEEQPGDIFAAFTPSAGSPPGSGAESLFIQKEEGAQEIPDVRELAYFIQNTWPIDMIWDFVRNERLTPTFMRDRAVFVDVVAGSGENPLGLELALALGVRPETAWAYIARGAERDLWDDILIPLVERVPQAFETIRPMDLEGRFFLAQDPSGKTVELAYSE